MDILLANAYHLAHDRKGQRIEGPYAPLGPLYIAAILRERGFKVGLYDGTFAHDGDFMATVQREQPAVVGLYNTVISRASAVEMLEACRRAGVPAVSGGPDPSAAPEVYLDAGAHAVGIGEGEMTAVEITEAFRGDRELTSVTGIAYRDGTTTQATAPRPRIDDLDSLPFPARDLLDWRKYAAATRHNHGKSQLTVMTSRGCPFECTWCCKPIFGRKYRHRSPANVAEEFATVKREYRPDSIRIADDVFTINRKLARETCQAIVDADAVVPFECLTRVDLVDEPTLDALRDAGCWRIYYGIESGSQRVLDSMKKGITLEQVDQASRWMKERGMEQYWFLMYGYPPEDERDLVATIRLLHDHQPEAWGVTVAYPLPQTAFFDLVSERMDGQPTAWRKTRDNQMMWDGDYPTLWYKAAIAGAHAAYRAGRLRRAGPIGAVADRIITAGVTGSLRVSGAAIRRWKGRRGRPLPSQQLPLAGPR